MSNPNEKKAPPPPIPPKAPPVKYTKDTGRSTPSTNSDKGVKNGKQ